MFSFGFFYFFIYFFLCVVFGDFFFWMGWFYLFLQSLKMHMEIVSQRFRISENDLTFENKKIRIYIIFIKFNSPQKGKMDILYDHMADIPRICKYNCIWISRMLVSLLYIFHWRFRVVDEIFVDTTPSGPDGTANQPSEISDTESKKTPYTIVVS